MPSVSLAQQSPTPLALFTVLNQLLSDAVSALDLDRDYTRNMLSRAVTLLETEQRALVAERKTTGLASWQINTVMVHIKENFEGNISVKDLANIVHLSRSRFSEAFKETFRVSPQRYILNRRIERAQEIMTTSQESLCQVAITCGFYDQSHFTRVFREVTGDTPYAWRRARHSPQGRPGVALL